MAQAAECCPTLRRLLSPALFKALGDPTRLSLLVSLAASGAERTVSAVGGCCSVDLSVVSRHLRILRDAGIVEAHRKGKEVRYRVRASDLARLLRELADALETECCAVPRSASALQATDGSSGGAP